MSPRRKRATIITVLLLFGVYHVRWAELEERRKKTNIPLMELVPVPSKDYEKNLLDVCMNKGRNRNSWNIVVQCRTKRQL